MTGNTQTISTTAVVVIPISNTGNRDNPRTLLIQNIDAANPVFLGGPEGLTASNGFRLASGESISFELQLYEQIFAIVPVTDVEIRYWILNAGESP